MFNWLREFYEMRRDARREDMICETCEVLKHELEVVRIENQQLLDRILHVPELPKAIDTSEIKPIMPRSIPWNVRKQILESEDRERARLLKQQSIQGLEQELGITEEKR